MGKHTLHPGSYVKEHVIPAGMTVTKAAKILGIGRPALSNFLNGKAALSPQMALRLEQVFRVDHEELQKLQAQFDHETRLGDNQTKSIGPYVPELVAVRAHDIQEWAGHLAARQELPALLRKLIYSTGGMKITRIDFPAYESAERKGWDGEVIANAPTAWIPIGKSGWEVSCSNSQTRKANHDYAARTRSVSPEERTESAFVFVTARKWPEKKDWAKEKAGLAQWKEVRAYDADDLEQWIEQSLSAQVWMSKHLGRPDGGCQLIEQWWDNWAGVCDPKLSPKLFASVVNQSYEKFKKWASQPPEHILTIVAASRDEALAFLYCLSQRVNADSDVQRSDMFVIDNAETLHSFGALFSAPIIAVIHDMKIAEQLGSIRNRCHGVVVSLCGEVGAHRADITVEEPLSREDFEKALAEMGISFERSKRLIRKSACSPTVLRRCLSNIPAIRNPKWKNDLGIAEKLFPAAMVGAWHTASTADQEVMNFLSGANDKREVEDNVRVLRNLEDTPLWEAGEYRGVASRIDSFFGVVDFITKSKFDDFMLIAEYVLSEEYPAIDLPADKRWLAGIYEKLRNHSDILRKGIRETLVILAVYGNDVLDSSLNSDVAREVSNLIAKLINPLDRGKILSFKRDLPDFAEAAPEVILAVIENDLQDENLIIEELMQPANNILSGPSRIDLLRALESLAWNPKFFPRVVDILAKLCVIERSGKTDNWLNKPERTLCALFKSWGPQTSATVEERTKAFRRLCKNYPDLGWSLCMEELQWEKEQWRKDDAFLTHRPRWRNDAASASCVVEDTRALDRESGMFTCEVTDLVLRWKNHTDKTLGELVDRLHGFSEDNQLKIWNLIDQWACSTDSDDAKARLRGCIKKSAKTRNSFGELANYSERERAAIDKLNPKDTVARHAWLFESMWIQLQGTEKDYEKNDEQLLELRQNALAEIWIGCGFDGVSSLLTKGRDTHRQIGWLMYGLLEKKNKSDIALFVKHCLSNIKDETALVHMPCLQAFLERAPAKCTGQLTQEIEHSCSQEELLHFFLCLPFNVTTWRRLDGKEEAFQNLYWEKVELLHFVEQGDEVNEAIDRLLDAKRAAAAFWVGHWNWDKVETLKLVKILSDSLTLSGKDFRRYANSGYHVAQAFDSLNKRTTVTTKKKAHLEFFYIQVLRGLEHGVPNLEKHMEDHPEVFVEILSYAYKRKDKASGEDADPPELRVENQEQKAMLAQNAYCFFDQLQHVPRRVPGTDENGEINPERTKKWIIKVRDLCAQVDRTEVADQMLGQLLSQAHKPEANSEVWPSRPICEVLEQLKIDDIGRGFVTGARNSRGIFWRALDDGGNQERELADRYTKWARKLVYEYPYVSRLLEFIAKSYRDQARFEDECDILEKRTNIP